MKTAKGRKYLDDFKKAPGGDYVYTGQIFVISGPGHAKAALAALSLLAAAAVIGSGCVNAAGLGNAFYVIIPYICEAAAAFALCWQTVKLCAAGRKIRAYVKDSAEKYLPAAAAGLIAAATAGLIASAVYLIINGTGGKPVMCGVYLALKAVQTVTGILTRKLVRSIGWQDAGPQGT